MQPIMGVVQLLPIQITFPEVENCPAHQEHQEEEEASNPEWPFDSHILLSSHFCIVCNREFPFLGDLYSHQDEDHQDLFLPLSEGEEIDDGSTYAL